MPPDPKHRRVCFVTGTRAEFGLMQSTLAAIRATPNLKLQIIATGMHLSPQHGNTARAIERDGWELSATVPWKQSAEPAQVAAATGSAIASLALQFQKLHTQIVLIVGDRVEARIVQRTATLLRAQACVDAMVVVSVTINLGPIPVAPPSSLCPSAALLEPRHVPADLTLQEMKELTGRISFAMQIAAMQSAFPDASRLLGAQRIAAIGCSSYLVGMIVPGLHSIYGGL